MPDQTEKQRKMIEELEKQMKPLMKQELIASWKATLRPGHSCYEKYGSLPMWRKSVERLTNGLENNEFSLDDTIWIRDGQLLDVIEGQEPDHLTVVHNPIPARQQIQNAATFTARQPDGCHYLDCDITVP